MSKTIIFKKGYPKTTRKNLFEDDGITPLSITNSKDTPFKYIGKTSALTNSIAEIQPSSYKWGIGTTNQAKFGKCEVGKTTSSICNAVRFVSYENGQPIIEDGCVFFTSSTATTYNGTNVYKMKLHTYEIELVGSILYKIGNAYYNHYPTASLMFDRNVHKWVVTIDYWAGNGYIHYGLSAEDLRLGYHVVEMEQMDYAGKNINDEDSYIIYDDDPESSLYQKYLLVYVDRGTIKICISDTLQGHYAFYGSKGGVSYTGVNTQKIGGVKYFITGTRARSDTEDKYEVLSYPNMTSVGYLNFDTLTGGTGGWGSVIAIPNQNDTKYLFLTFDRGVTSDYDEWTYGTTYIYESVEVNSGHEYPVKTFDGYEIEAHIESDYTPIQLHFTRRFAKTFYFNLWLNITGLYPTSLLNRSRSNELPLVSATIQAQEDSFTMLAANGNGFGYVSEYVPLATYKIRLYNVDGVAYWFIADNNFEHFRKVIFTINNGMCSISVYDDIIGNSPQIISTSLSFAIVDYVDILIGVNIKDFTFAIK